MKERKHVKATRWIDPDDAAELTDDFFIRANEYVGDRLLRCGWSKDAMTKPS